MNTAPNSAHLLAARPFAASLLSAMPQTEAFQRLCTALNLPPLELQDLLVSCNVLAVDPMVLNPMSDVVTHSDFVIGTEVLNHNYQISGSDLINSFGEVHNDTVSALKAAGLDMSLWVLQEAWFSSHNEKDLKFMCALTDELMEDPTHGTVFYAFQKADFKPFPIGFTWRPLKEAIAEFESNLNSAGERQNTPK